MQGTQWITVRVLKSKVENAYVTLVNAVDNIRDQVSVQITRTEPDMNAILAITNNLGRFSAQLSQAQVAGEVRGEFAIESYDKGDDQAIQSNEVEVEKLINSINALAKPTNVIKRIVKNSIQLAAASGDISECEVENIATGIQLIPDVDQIMIKQGETFQLAVIGSTGIPRAALTGLLSSDENKRLDLDTDVENGTFVATLKASATTQAGSYGLLITGANASDMGLVNVTVAEKAEGIDDDGQNSEVNSLKEAMKNIQVAGPIVIDGVKLHISKGQEKDGNNKPFIQFDVIATGVAEKPVEIKQLKKELIQKDPGSGIAENDIKVNLVEWRGDNGERPTPDATWDALSDTERKEIQESLCQSAGEIDGSWGKKTKAALGRYEWHATEKASGILTDKIRADLKKVTDDEIEERCSVVSF